jgi:uncharacterized protein (DUF2237 family)
LTRLSIPETFGDPDRSGRASRAGKVRWAWEGVEMKEPSVNVLGEPLQPCSTDPVTGFFRNGCCDTGPMDRGLHTVCATMTAEFLALSKYLGNDLSTPRPEYGFPGLKPGDQWCLCANRFLQAHEEGAAPKIRLAATHQATLDVVPLAVLQEHAV